MERIGAPDIGIGAGKAEQTKEGGRFFRQLGQGELRRRAMFSA
jgi:hypothetical protein